MSSPTNISEYNRNASTSNSQPVPKARKRKPYQRKPDSERLRPAPNTSHTPEEIEKTTQRLVRKALLQSMDSKPTVVTSVMKPSTQGQKQNRAQHGLSRDGQVPQHKPPTVQHPTQGRSSTLASSSVPLVGQSSMSNSQLLKITAARERKTLLQRERRK
jgi:hypothetical protein